MPQFKKNKQVEETGIYHLDLISTCQVNPESLARFLQKLKKLDIPPEMKEAVSESSVIGKSGKLEIYIDEGEIEMSNAEEFFECVTKVEKELCEFADHSKIIWTYNFPFYSKGWEKNKYEWEIQFEEKDDFYEDMDLNIWTED